MNQILSTSLKSDLKTLKKQKTFFKIQLTLSIVGSFILVSILFLYINSLSREEKQSNNILSSYNVYKLYAQNNDSSTEELNDIFGIIEIPKINIYYPIFSKLSEEHLKSSPCKFYGGNLHEYSNICIAAHNYNNSMFFSNISSLTIDDTIFIYDLNNSKFTYLVTDVYEVKENDLSPVFNYKDNKKELTLVTCNNLNNNRIIVKAENKNN